MTYDIGIGSCIAINGEAVLVKLDSVMVKRLVPGSPWRKSGTSTLTLNRALCSPRRKPEVGSEVYLDRATLTRAAPGKLDLTGDGTLLPVDLRLLLDNLDPQPAPTPSVKGRSMFGRR
ncbi:MAG TPA: hypothetical protein VMR06_08115 [Dokdonella sp.]|uniref:hypothetical protein n=1 Tax=Dokdonella sp. TaxID=2291710 RepID=UPI002CA44886|nr:hypothetical protein [Dokdonella sp.]HUD41948.1 hypothetical protein [Dokdonella sp.]